MKNFFPKSLLIIALLISTISFAQSTKTINTTTSSINWLAKKLVGQHEGTILFKSGQLDFDANGKLNGGNFVVNMNSLTATDLSGDYLKKLNDHLKASDFFDTAKHPTSTLSFTKVVDNNNGSYSITGNLVIKNISKSITFKLYLASDKLTSKLKVDRTKYNIKYASGSFFENLGDKAIEDNFTLDIILKY